LARGKRITRRDLLKSENREERKGEKASLGFRAKKSKNIGQSNEGKLELGSSFIR